MSPERDALLRAIEAQKRVIRAAIAAGEEARRAREEREREALLQASQIGQTSQTPTLG